MDQDYRVAAYFAALGGDIIPLSRQDGLEVRAPGDGALIARLARTTPQALDGMPGKACAAQAAWRETSRKERAQVVESLAAALKLHRETLAALITLEGGKTPKEALAEADSAADMLLKTIRDSTLPELGGMLRVKERPPVNVVGLITSFNFPLAVASWTLAPALLAGNAVLWKPSEKTPLTALAVKAIFDKAAGRWDDLLQVAIGEREIGGALVAHEQVDMISATGSVGMGEGIRLALAKKQNNAVHPILELGGNNGAIISHNMSPEHLDWSVRALLNSFFGTSGQRCTNTRRLIVHRSVHDKAVELLRGHIEALLASGAVANPLLGASNDYGYGPLIDKDAFMRFGRAKTQAAQEGGSVLFGERLLATDYPDAYYVAPCLALLPVQSGIMHEETFAPILFVVPYDGDIDHALTLLNAPANAGLVNAIYTQSQKEADRFALLNQAGHGVINPPKGTGTPAHGMGFGGNKASGEGEILNSADPLQAFTRPGHFNRIAQNKDILMNTHE